MCIEQTPCHGSSTQMLIAGHIYASDGFTPESVFICTGRTEQANTNGREVHLGNMTNSLESTMAFDCRPYRPCWHMGQVSSCTFSLNTSGDFIFQHQRTTAGNLPVLDPDLRMRRPPFFGLDVAFSAAIVLF